MGAAFGIVQGSPGQVPFELGLGRPLGILSFMLTPAPGGLGYGLHETEVVWWACLQGSYEPCKLPGRLFILFFKFSFILSFGNRVFLCSPGWPCTHILPPECWDYSFMPLCLANFFLKFKLHSLFIDT
jgi:hypothetical protein